MQSELAVGGVPCLPFAFILACGVVDSKMPTIYEKKKKKTLYAWHKTKFSEIPEICVFLSKP